MCAEKGVDTLGMCGVVGMNGHSKEVKRQRWDSVLIALASQWNGNVLLTLYQLLLVCSIFLHMRLCVWFMCDLISDLF